MKTPKRYQNKPLPCMPEDSTVDDMVIDVWCQRAKRKNRIAQYKRTIARLTDESRRFREFRLGGHLKIYSPEWEAFMVLSRLKTPAEDATLEEKLDHWLTLRKVTELALDAVCFAAKAYGAADEKERAACNAHNAENAKQATLLCADAEQLTERKGN